MDDMHRRAIQRNFGSLVEQTDLDLMVTALYEKGVFSERMIERYKDTNKSVRDRKRELYVDIQGRGPHAFQHLIDALQELGYWNLVRDIDPSSNLHPHNPRPPAPQPQENSFISLSGEKKKTKTEMETQNNPNFPPEEHELEPNIEDPGTEDLIDPVPDTDVFHVKKSTKFFEDNNSDIKLYRTRGPRGQRGVLLIFSYIEFKYGIESFRNGVDVDCSKLKDLFHEMGFTMTGYLNLTKKETLETLKSLNSVLRGVECVFIVVSSHGYSRDGTTDVDFRCHCGGLMSIYEFLEHFNNKKLPVLVGVPKVFIFQICRGKSEDWHTGAEGGSPASWGAPGSIHNDGSPWGGGGPDRPPAHHRPPHDDYQMDSRKRLYSDMLIVHSTLPGFVSRRDPARGSWYIQVLCEVFAARAHDSHVEELFTLVDVELERRFEIQTSSIDKWGFNRKLYLHPGLYGDV